MLNLDRIADLLISGSRFVIIALLLIYTIQSYTIFRTRDSYTRRSIFLRQNISTLAIHTICFAILFIEEMNAAIPAFYAVQAIYLILMMILMTHLYPRASRILINHMMMLISIGLIMITRISFDYAVRQFRMILLGSVVSLIVPLIVRKVMVLTRLAWAYMFVGLGLLGLVVVAARVTNGAKLALSVGGFSFQPSEFVKIVFVFAIAGLLTTGQDLKRIMLATALAALHVLLLVVSKDLGSALIFFVTYLAILFAATRNPFLVLAGILSGAMAAVAAYLIFYHVRVRVLVWSNPFADYNATGYQICQSLFSIAAGGWIGTGLGRGTPGAIPYVQQDFMFSAICEELGGICAVCIILICMSCFIMIVNVAMRLQNRFYRLVALGLGTTYATQVFLTVGGGTKLIPMTGVTLPLISYGGSSALSTLIMFAIIQGLYMLRKDEEIKDDKLEEEAYQNGPFDYAGAPGEEYGFSDSGYGYQSDPGAGGEAGYRSGR